MVKPFTPADYSILIVDDSLVNLKVVGSILQQIGYSTALAHSGAQAMEQLNRVKPDLVLLDLMMPDMDGLEFCELLKANRDNSDVSIIFLTASQDRAHLLQAFEQGACDYVTKPFNRPELAARVKTHLMLKHTVNELKLALGQMEQLAKTDGLTGLLNRRSLFEAAEQEFLRAQRYSRPLSILMLDIDHFKRINDTYGHQIGDRVIQQVADVLKAALRQVDITGRYGGEEFVVVLPETDLHQSIEVAERLRYLIDSLSTSTVLGELRITASVGVAVRRDQVRSIEEMLNQADKALYQAKTAGRNTWVISTELSVPEV